MYINIYISISHRADAATANIIYPEEKSRHMCSFTVIWQIGGLVQDCSISSALTILQSYSKPSHWGSSHEGSGRHPRQHGGGRGRRFGKFTANSHRVCSLLRPSFCELIVNVMGHIDAEFRVAVVRYLAAIPA